MKIHFFDTQNFSFKEKQKAQINDAMQAQFKKIKKLLPQLSDSINITIYPHKTYHIISETGDGGYSAAPEWVAMFVNPWFKGGLEVALKSLVCGTLYHELHHVAAGYTFADEEWNTHLLASTVYEGLGTVFERDFGGSKPLWGEYPDDIEKWLVDLRSAVKAPGYNYAHWSFEHPDGRKWIKYRVGTYIVDQAIKNNPTETAVTLVRTPVVKILKMAGL